MNGDWNLSNVRRIPAIHSCALSTRSLVVHPGVMRPRSAGGAVSRRPQSGWGARVKCFANAYIIEGESGVVVVDALQTRTGSRDLRRRVAASLLLATTRPVAEITYGLGFNDLSHFYTRFKSAFGCASGAWRQTRRA